MASSSAALLRCRARLRKVKTRFVRNRTRQRDQIMDLLTAEEALASLRWSPNWPLENVHDVKKPRLDLQQ